MKRVKKEDVGQHVVVLICKHPVPGKVKTRFIRESNPEISKIDAAEFAECCIGDILEKLQKEMDPKSSSVRILCNPPECEDAFVGLFKESGPHEFVPWDTIRKKPNSLGDILEDVYIYIHNEWKGRPCYLTFIGMDCLTLPNLSKLPVVMKNSQVDGLIHPSSDGGYCALTICLKDNIEYIFRDIGWSNESTCEDQYKRLVECGFKTNIDETQLIDVDNFGDFAMLWKEYKDLLKDTRVGKWVMKKDLIP
jgi:glycosyltransferase A (GT-A) superfamily protein (DUF2064 family)